jgi:hydrogenase nickel incorporation protein HypA/HybF
VHELTIALEIVRLVTDSLGADKLARVKRLNLVIGRATAVQEDCLRLGLEAAAMNTPLSGTEVGIEYVEPLFRCRDCGREFDSNNWFYAPCPGCGGFRNELIKGDELSVASVELE